MLKRKLVESQKNKKNNKKSLRSGTWFPPNTEFKWVEKVEKRYKNKWWRAAEFHLVNVFEVPEFTISKIRGFKFRNSYQVLPHQL